MAEADIQRQKTVHAALARGTWLTAGQINARQSPPPADRTQPAAEWKDCGRIFSVTSDDGLEYFAGYQFDASCQPLPVIRDILAALGQVRDSWKIAAWFHFPNGWIAGTGANESQPVAPMDALERPDAVIGAARRNRGTYVA
ncbi:hypothetical protein [Paraburkholderia silvatlantica]|uniref:Uncharacterized protein n=1 Tax=Paraburkholderia silvatlantica TaxID=321895 RepID=A0A2V4TXN5_9BURK|nr:hypothetical protein [Paraburkholderia silvatlantica]PYE26138.1 hypothetical protein C7410_10354 [Paraburkholderia silvatlantica]TDQ93032.1 hypothetical protein C7412_10912 [Paraburkholderia silvatlantica]